MATSENKRDSRMAVGIFGGTFDPIHFGHLRVAREAMDTLGLHALRWVPAFQPPLRAAPVATAAQRTDMLSLVVGDLPDQYLDTREIERGGISYTIDTLESLRAEQPDAALCLLVGRDQFNHFERWRRWQDILNLAHLVVLDRPGVAAGHLPEWARTRLCADAQALRQRPAERLLFLAVSPQEISATAIRARLAEHQPVADQVPPGVLDYIYSNHLYGSAERGEICKQK